MLYCLPDRHNATEEEEKKVFYLEVQKVNLPSGAKTVTGLLIGLRNY
jgi:hypothetical protein